MFLVKWKKVGVHYHCRVFATRGHPAKIGDLTLDEKDWENFQLSILAKHWKLTEEDTNGKGGMDETSS